MYTAVHNTVITYFTVIIRSLYCSYERYTVRLYSLRVVMDEISLRPRVQDVPLIVKDDPSPEEVRKE